MSCPELIIFRGIKDPPSLITLTCFILIRRIRVRLRVRRVLRYNSGNLHQNREDCTMNLFSQAGAQS